MNSILENVAGKVLGGERIEFSEAMELAQNNIDNESLFSLADKLCKKHMGNKVDLCTIMNTKSGKCSENCKYCAQSGHYNTQVESYPLVDAKEVLKLAKQNEKEGVHRFAIVTSGGRLSDTDFDKVLEMIVLLKKETSLGICASLGSMTLERAVMLKQAGLSMYHHNIETSREYYPQICDTHTYDTRIDTIKNIQKAQLKVCCGGIIGLGESMEHRIKMAFELRDLGIKSVPINILNPIKGTPLENVQRPGPEEILKTLALFRIILPDASIRYAAGRISLGDYQKKGFAAGVNAMMVGNYLTTVGNQIADDMEMVKGLGLEV